MSRRESAARTVLVAAALSVVCSVVVSSAATLLRPAQERNKLLDQKRNVLAAGGLLDKAAPAKEVEAAFAQIEAQVVRLDTGAALPDVDPAEFDLRAEKKDPTHSAALPQSEDPAGINRRPERGIVYLAKGPEGGLDRVILPIHGYGLWSTMWGFLALEDDLETVAGIGFYDHGETPGLGGEIDNPTWQARWHGKHAFDAEGRPALSITKQEIVPGEPKAKYQIDALSGATITSRGLEHTVNYWLGPNGFGPTLDRLRRDYAAPAAGAATAPTAATATAAHEEGRHE